MAKIKAMWAIHHIPSGSWDHGDSTLTLYPFKHRAQRECVTESFTPIEVWITDVPPPPQEQP